MWSALVGLTLFLLYSVALFVVYFIGEDASLLRFNCNFPSNLTACDPSLGILGFRLPNQANPVLPSLCATCAVLALVGLIFLGHLAAFHVYLSTISIVGAHSTINCVTSLAEIKGQSTYDFFSRRKDDAGTAATKPHPPPKHLSFLRSKKRVS